YIQIDLNDTLQGNTTYSFNFGQSIVDNNEGNPYPYLKYVFSTGEYVDSLAVRGTIGNAFNREADNFVSVMLYAVDSTYTDSIIYKKQPTYLTNTLDSLAFFEIANAKAGQYLLVAQKDVANNYTFDQQVDKIGFSSSFIELPTDSLFHLDLFLEKADFSFGRSFQAGQNRIGFGYVGDPEGIDVELITPLPDSIKTTVSFDKESDTLYFWYKNLAVDSLLFELKRDTLVKEVVHRLRPEVLDSLTLSPSHNGRINLADSLRITTNTPIDKIDNRLIKLFDKDTVPIPFEVLVENPHDIRVEFEMLPNDNYQLELLPGAISDFFETTHDTLKYTFKTGSRTDFGGLYLQVFDVPSYPIIIQLTDEKENVVRSLYVTEPQRQYSFLLLKPNKYYLRVIVDENQNGVWDSGRYLERRLPEPVYHYEPLLDVRANWELQERFILK
ncbi:MAG: Ig-like domain-containing protein, partial [Flavobacteriaceae bacterium]